MISLYHFTFIKEFSSSEANVSKLKQFESMEDGVNNLFDIQSKFRNWLLPRLIVEGEVLIPIERDKLVFLKELNISLSSTPIDRSYRNFNLADLSNSILINTNLKKSNLTGASLEYANLNRCFF